jgi:hypothetical protein
MDTPKHSPFPWWQSNDCVVMSGKGDSVVAVAYASKEDGEIIVSAVNNTYGKGINPEPTDTPRTCKNCRHWRDKAWTDKGWGICDNPKNEVKAGPLGVVRGYGRHYKLPQDAIDELVTEVENGTRYPEDFGCIFFEPIN